MKHLFVSYEIALKLKEKGFDDPCLSKYNNSGKMDIASIFGITNSLLKGEPYRKYGWVCTAPLYQQVIDWFREAHSIDIFTNAHYATDNSVAGYLFDVYDRREKYNTQKGMFESSSYYQALNKAIEEALKLIKK